MGNLAKQFTFSPVLLMCEFQKGSRVWRALTLSHSFMGCIGQGGLCCLRIAGASRAREMLSTEPWISRLASRPLAPTLGKMLPGRSGLPWKWMNSDFGWCESAKDIPGSISNGRP